MTNYKIPKPEFVSCVIDGNGFYAWKCESKKYDLCVYGNTAKQAREEYIDAMQSEHGLRYGGRNA